MRRKVAVTGATGYIGQCLTSVLAELSREPVVLRLSLDGLDRQAVGEFLERAAAELASPELAEALAKMTEGNPLFLGETLLTTGNPERAADAALFEKLGLQPL